MILTLAACGGSVQPEVVAPQEVETQLNYTPAAGARHSYTPYVTQSHTYVWAPGNPGDDVREIYIGGDLEPVEHLRHIMTENGIRYYMGASRDGVGVARLENYETDLMTRDGADPFGLFGLSDQGFAPFVVQPYLYYDTAFLEPENAEIAAALYDSVLILNDVLPPEYQIVVDGVDNPDFTLPGEIEVHLKSARAIRAICGADAVACASNDTLLSVTLASALYLPDDFDTTEYIHPRRVIVHELLHALGIMGHVDSIEFPDSIMGSAGDHIPNLGHIISKIDREVLQIMYMSQRTDLYNDWDEWSDTTFHIAGRTEDENLRFGIALFNGLPQPWMRGALPENELADNARLRGTVTWSGSLLGFSGPSPIAGDAELEVRMAALQDPEGEHDLRFRDIAFVNRYESDDFSESSDRWFDTRNIDYKVGIIGNGFSNIDEDGYEHGHVTGTFAGSRHEHMGGTLKRTDMVAAFGGSK